MHPGYLRRTLICAAAFALFSSASTPVSIAPGEGLLAVVNPDSRSVSFVDTITRSVREVAVVGTPQTVTFAPDRERAFVATREGDLIILDVKNARTRGSVVFGTELFGVVADSRRLYVSAPRRSRVFVVDLQSLEPVSSIATD